MENERKPSLYVTEDLVIDILLRLPVKSLSRFKCVSKKWCSLIESPSFVKQHFGHERNPECLLICLGAQMHDIVNNYAAIDEENYDSDDWDSEINQYLRKLRSSKCKYTYALYVDETFSEYEYPAHLQLDPFSYTYYNRKDVDDLSVFGPLNGVFCLVSSFPWGPMALLNPALRQFKPLPLYEEHVVPDYWKPYMTLSGDEQLGIGLDPLTGDYKVVVIIRDIYWISTSETVEECFISVCNSDSDSWKIVDDVDLVCMRHPARTSLCNTYLNGAYYWLSHPNEATEVVVLAFDMGTEKFRTMLVTRCESESNAGYLGLSGDTLALLMYDDDGNMNVWMMENENDGGWIRRFRVGTLPGIRKPLSFLRNNEVLLETVSGLLAKCNNVSTQELKSFEVGLKKSSWIWTYKESLASIKGKADKCKFWNPSSQFVKDFFKPYVSYPDSANGSLAF